MYLFNNSPKVGKADLTEKHLKLEHDKKEWETFVIYTLKLAKDENSFPDGASLLTKLQKHMPHFTPDCLDKVVYITVDEVHSGSADNVVAF